MTSPREPKCMSSNGQVNMIYQLWLDWHNQLWHTDIRGTWGLLRVSGNPDFQVSGQMVYPVCKGVIFLNGDFLSWRCSWPENFDFHELSDWSILLRNTLTMSLEVRLFLRIPNLLSGKVGVVDIFEWSEKKEFTNVYISFLSVKAMSS